MNVKSTRQKTRKEVEKKKIICFFDFFSLPLPQSTICIVNIFILCGSEASKLDDERVCPNCARKASQTRAGPRKAKQQSTPTLSEEPLRVNRRGKGQGGTSMLDKSSSSDNGDDERRESTKCVQCELSALSSLTRMIPQRICASLESSISIYLLKKGFHNDDCDHDEEAWWE